MINIKNKKIDTETLDPAQDKMDSSLDLWAGCFFIIVAAVGWYSHLTNEHLATAFIMGEDPGPGFLAKIALWIITAGGIGYLLKGSGSLRGIRIQSIWQSMLQHKISVLYVASIIFLIVLVPVIGFITSAFLFSSFWLFWLSLEAGLERKQSAFFAFYTSITICIFLYVVFFYLLNININ